MPAPGVEQPILVRQFKGTIVSLDPAFIGKEYLQRSENWLPDDFTFLLAKRRGTPEYARFVGATRVDRMLRVQNDVGDRYLCAVGALAGNDVLRARKNDAGAFVDVVLGAFATLGARYGLARIANTLYAGNGAEALKEVPLVDPLTAINLTALGTTDVTGATSAATVDAASTLLAGTHAFRWAVFNAGTKRWVSVGAVTTITTASGSRQRLDFKAPTGGGLEYHLFVAPANEEIEGAHDQTPGGLAPGVTFSLGNEPTITGPPVPIPSSVERRGSILTPHLGRLFVAGDDRDPAGFFATDVLRQGGEQAIFDRGTFFPANAQGHLRSRVTALAVASLTTTQDSPSSPLVVFSDTSTVLLLGDILDDPNADFVELSDHQGCVSASAWAHTPAGLVYVGHESVYLLRADLGNPVDIGWPIWPVLRAIPRALRPFVECVYHKGFLKVAIAGAGDVTLKQQWWLDLRRPFDPAGDVPPWWGPMTMGPLGVSCFAQSEHEPDEDDRAWAAITPGASDLGGPFVYVSTLAQPRVYRDLSVAVASRAKTARIDGGKPFDRKVVTRVRAIARVAESTKVGVVVSVDGMRKTSGTMVFPGSPAAQFNHLVAQGKARFNSAMFGSVRDAEGDYRTDSGGAARPQGQAIEVELTHTDPTGIVLRDLEMTYLPIERPTA